MPPCVLDTSDRARIFFELFRPEAMQYLPALSPDALSIFVSTATAESVSFDGVDRPVLFF